MRTRCTIQYAVSLLALVVGGCASRSFPLLTTSSFAFATDTLRTRRVGDGVAHHFIYSPAGPWAIHVLDVNLARCNTAVAVKGASGAEGRMLTSDLMRDLARTRDVVGGVNADFFLFTPPGVPTGALVSGGRVITPPSAAPVFAMDSAGIPHIRTFTLRGGAKLAVGDPALANASFAPFHPLEAVGGRPVMARDSTMVANIDSAGGVAFSTTRHPRTAIGIANNRTRLLLVVVDGRQKPYSDGMTLRELASLMLALGARDALNLDGGGSTTMVYADSARGMHVANHPSDPAGERPVGDALAIVRGCKPAP
ncbi:MAG: phosphodiester glycosidase family protein [Phycisphaerae bacterium]|nr:phosphodiester glycosidase family protein [Gemmatimonadaceae bacterium]